VFEPSVLLAYWPVVVSGFRRMKRVEIYLRPSGWDTVKFVGIHSYTWVERGTVRVNCLAQNTTPCPRPRLEHRPLDPKSYVLIIKDWHLPLYIGVTTLADALNVSQSIGVVQFTE